VKDALLAEIGEMCGLKQSNGIVIVIVKTICNAHKVNA